MSASGKKKARDLVESYRTSLEHRIEQGDWNLVCRDEDLCKQVEGLLRDSCAQNTHSTLGLDPLSLMEESLKTVPPALGRAGSGLERLARAFEVLELAALNLYLCPWRKEYRVVKMFSGMFTHYVKPALSMQQVLELFGLLGYHATETRWCEELQLCSPAVPVDTLLRLSCAFFTARCECQLLLANSGERARGGLEWELSLVQERQKGHSLQVALENTKKRLETTLPLKEELPELSPMGLDLDLYTAEDLECNNAQRESGFNTSPTIVRGTNGISTPRETVCVSTLNCQLTKTAPLVPTINSPSYKQRESSYEELSKSVSERVESHSLTSQASRNGWGNVSAQKCSSIQSHNQYIQHCKDCNTLHGVSSACLSKCQDKGHEICDLVKSEHRESRMSLTPQRGSPREGGVALPPVHEEQRQSPVLLDQSDGRSLTTPQPIPLHGCCDPAHPDPRIVCISCMVFHTSECREVAQCLRNHDIRELGVCSSGQVCTKPPHILCRYCSAEYCKDCWYRTPLDCACGQPFDQSTTV